MEKISCNIIKDILPLYVDGVTSEDTNKMVEEHLEACEDCRQESEKLNKKVELLTDDSVQEAEVNSLKAIKKKFNFKKLIVSVVSIAVTVGVLFGIFAFLTVPKYYIPIEDIDYKFQETADDRLYLKIDEDVQFDGICIYDPEVTKINGEEKKVVVFYLYETLWSKYIEPLYSDRKGDYEIELSTTTVEEDVTGYKHKIVDPVDEVYYGNFKSDFESDNLKIWDNLGTLLDGYDLVWSN